jgi:hypothetical protein
MKRRAMTGDRPKGRAFEPVTLGHIRGHGCRDLLIYCDSGWCHHGATMNADWLPDDTPVRSLCSRMVCTRCGVIGADVRPDWRPHTQSAATQRSVPAVAPARRPEGG